MFKRILIAVDGSEPAEYAAQRGADLALKLGAEVAFVTILPAPPAIIADVEATGARLDARWDHARLILDRCRAQLPRSMKVEEIISEGSGADEIVQQAIQWHADLVIVGTHSRHGLPRLLLGSTAESVIRRAPCTVMVVRRPPEQPLDELCGVVQAATRDML